MSRDSDWYFSSVFRLMFPARWSVHDLNSLVSSSARVACCLLISLYFFSLHFTRRVNIWYSSSFLLIHIFVTQHIWQQNNFYWIYSLVGCWKHALCCTDNLNRLVMLYCVLTLGWFCNFFFFCFKLVGFRSFSIGLFRLTSQCLFFWFLELTSECSGTVTEKFVTQTLTSVPEIILVCKIVTVFKLQCFGLISVLFFVK